MWYVKLLLLNRLPLNEVTAPRWHCVFLLSLELCKLLMVKQIPFHFCSKSIVVVEAKKMPLSSLLCLFVQRNSTHWGTDKVRNGCEKPLKKRNGGESN